MKTRPSGAQAPEYDPESALVTRILVEGDIAPVLKARIGSEHLHDDEVNAVYDWIGKRFQKYGKVPSIGLAKQHFPEFKFVDPPDDLPQIIRTIQDKKLYADLQKALKSIATLAREDSFEALEELKNHASTLSVGFSESDGRDATKSKSDILRRYNLYKKSKGLLGLPWPWERLNRCSRGIRKGAFYALYGPPGTMKTWLLIVIADFVHRLGARPIFFTYEMPPEDIEFRWACLRACVDYDRVQDGKLTAKEEKRFLKAVEAFAKEKPFIIESITSKGKAALAEIDSKTQEHNANIRFVDGLQFVGKDLEWTSFAETTMGLKEMSRRSLIPTIASHHTNRGKKKKATNEADADDVALGETLFRDTDGLFRLSMTPQDRQENQLHIVVRKMREGKLPAQFYTHARPAEDFSQKRVVTEEGEEGEGKTTLGDAGEEDDDGFK